MKVIDLSLELAEDMPCWWPGFQPFEAKPTSVIGPDTGGGYSRSMVIEEHMGTHMDAPIHVGNFALCQPIGLESVMDIPLGNLMGRARVLDVRHIKGIDPGISPWIGPCELERLEAESVPVVAGDAVLLWSGWSDERYRPFPEGSAFVADPVARETPGWPAPSAEFVSCLADRGVAVLGVDTPTLGATHDPLPPHRAALSAGITPVEGLTNLASLYGETALFVFLPLPIRNGSGSPGRAVALIEEHE